MIYAELISLSDGQSYKDVQICEEADLDAHNIPRPFEEWTACVFTGGKFKIKCLIIHHWKIKVIQLDRIRRNGVSNSDRLILDGDITYSPVSFIHEDNWDTLGIPKFFVKRNGIAGQLAFSTQEGTFITHDTNVTSIIIPDPRPSGITKAERPAQTPQSVIKKNSMPETVHGRIFPRAIK